VRYRQQVLEGVSESVGVLGARARGHPASDRGWTDEASGRTLPKFVTEELHGFMSRGILGRGFAHLFCHTCHEHHVVAFSCKARAVCPSELLRRTFGFEIVCHKCQSPLRLIALIKNQDIAKKILVAMHLPASVPELDPARPPPAADREARDADDWLN